MKSDNKNPKNDKDKSTSALGRNSEFAPLYAARERIHPKRVWGMYRKFKWLAMGLLLGMYYIAPWLRWDRGPSAPDQAFLIDMPARRAYFLWIEIWPQEVYYFAGILIIAAFGLFLATALLGRVWCGFTCPQTVWTDLFIWVERIIEGDRSNRIRLDKAPWSVEKIRKRIVKHTIWLLISLFTGGAWIMFFTDAPTLVKDIINLNISGNIILFVGLFSGITYLLAGFAREQVCTYMCPWPRIQASMLDEDSLIVTYERWRGEPRAKPTRDADYDNRGHCIDCNNCVVVCPTGIDIRDGNQLECIGCGLCIDACNNVMDKINLPHGLITYDSVNRSNARAENKVVKYRLFRMRTILYSLLMLVSFVVMFYSLATRNHLEVNVLADRNPLFVTLKNGSIRNGYTFKILNKSTQPRKYILWVENLDGAAINAVGIDTLGNGEILSLSATADAVMAYRIYVKSPRKSLTGENTDYQFHLKEIDMVGEQEEVIYNAIFHGPKR